MGHSAELARWRNQIRGLRRVAFDTSAIIYYLEGVSPYEQLVAEVIDLLALGALRATVSTVVEAEALVKPLRESNQLGVDRIELFFRRQPGLVVRSVDRTVARRAASIRAGVGLALPDALVIATALEEGCQAIVGNDLGVAKRLTELPYLYLQSYIL